MKSSKGWLLFAAAPLLGCIASTATNESYPFDKIRRIGVIDAGSGRWSDLGAGDLMAKHLLRRGYSVIERSKLEALLEEQRLGLTGLYSPETVKEIGRVLGVDALIFAQVTSYAPARRRVVKTHAFSTEIEPVFKKKTKKRKDGSRVEYQVQVGTRTHHQTREVPQIFTVDAQAGIVVKLIDVETGEIIWIGSRTGEGINGMLALESAISYLVRKLRKQWRPFSAAGTGGDAVPSNKA